MSSSMMNNEYMPETWNSLFVPSVPSCLIDENIFKDIIENVMCLGRVKRIDFLQREKPKTMAFIHFYAWNNLPYVNIFRNIIDMEEHNDVSDIYVVPFKKYVFLRFKQNKTPIKETELNIEQLADCLEMAECKIREQTDDINEILKEFEDYKTQKEKEINEKEAIIQQLLLKLNELNKNNE